MIDLPKSPNYGLPISADFAENSEAVWRQFGRSLEEVLKEFK
jgi:hypothetical protein